MYVLRNVKGILSATGTQRTTQGLNSIFYEKSFGLKFLSQFLNLNKIGIILAVILVDIDHTYDV